MPDSAFENRTFLTFTVVKPLIYVTTMPAIKDKPMENRIKRFQTRHIGIISTRIAGTDGVSLEIEKWAAVLEKEGLHLFLLCW